MKTVFLVTAKESLNRICKLFGDYNRGRMFLNKNKPTLIPAHGPL